MNPAEENVERLIALTERLTQRIAEDAAVFEARQSHEAAARVEETARLANLYRHESARVREDPSTVAAASPERRARLMQASRSFDQTLVRHGRAVFAAKVVTEGIVRAIAEEVVAARSAGAGYGPTARLQSSSSAAIAVNRQA